ncbi:hypothetical protein [Chryseobacterium sp.]|uniref:hypothetical protein n=1 Tax=Chryseobacterium sp. TaxID=1871047 RepID=UPI000ECD0207|nr:hypothetical protein [Chryseobacterium sp.]HCM33460.1 hypothetical protein [Chryseobacterium sp.]
MKILKKVKLEHHLRTNLYVCIFLLVSSSFFSQKLSDYYLTTKIVSFKDPLIIVPDYDKVGIFIVESEDFNKEKNLKSLFKQKKAFLFDTDGFSYKSYNERKEMGYKEDEYDYVDRKEDGKTIILRLSDKVKSFYISFIKMRYYNYIDASAHARYPYLKDTENFEPILIPCFFDKVGLNEK